MSTPKQRSAFHRLAPALLLATVVAGCERSPTDQAPADPSPEIPTKSSALMSVTPPAMQSGIGELLESWSAAWQAMDGEAYASHYSEDMDFVNPLGAVVSGRDAMAAIHTFLFNPVDGPFRGSVQVATIRRIVPLTGSIAIVDLTVDLTGYEGTLPGGLVEWRPGVVRTRSRMIVQRIEGTWQIRASQLTAVQPFLPN